MNGQLLESKLIESLYNHISLELYDEYGYTFYNNAHIYERLGSFENSGKIVSFIFEYLLKHIDEQRIAVDCFKLNTFFDAVDIYVKHGNTIEGDYYKRIGNTIYLHISVPHTIVPHEHWTPIMKIILHELLHAYEDYNRSTSIFDMFSDEYNRSVKFMRTSYTDISKKVFEFGYLFNDQERNAYFSNLYNDVKYILKKTNMMSIENFDYGKFINELKMTDIWKRYFEIVSFAHNIDFMSEDDKTQLINVFSFIKHKQMTLIQIKYEMKHKIFKFINKFNQLVPKCICDILYVPNKKLPIKKLPIRN